MRQALTAYEQGEYDRAADLWEKALWHNGGLAVACRGIGRARLQQGEYEEAMDYLKRGGDRYFYSLAVQEARREFTRANLWWILPAVVAGAVGLFWLIKRIKRAILRSAKKEGRPS